MSPVLTFLRSLIGVVGIAFGLAGAGGWVLAWGDNRSGQLNVPWGLTNIVDIAAGKAHSLALRADATVVAWGANDFGQLRIPDGLSNVIAIAAGEQHNLAVRSDGTVVAWGRGDSGQANVPAGLSNVMVHMI